MHGSRPFIPHPLPLQLRPDRVQLLPRLAAATLARMPRSPRQPKETPDSAASAEDGLAATLSFRQAQAAFELCLAELQAGDLDVEAMAGLYRRALAYSARCEELLQQVEQEVMQWDAERPDDAPEPFPS